MKRSRDRLNRRMIKCSACSSEMNFDYFKKHRTKFHPDMKQVFAQDLSSFAVTQQLFQGNVHNSHFFFSYIFIYIWYLHNIKVFAKMGSVLDKYMQTPEFS